MTIKLITSITLSLISLSNYAQSNENTVHQALKASGCDAIFSQFDHMVNRQINQKKSAFKNEAEFEQFSTVLSKSLNTKHIKTYFVEYFVKETNEDSLQKVISLYEKPLLIEINKMEEEAINPANQKDQIAFFKGLKSNPPSQKRLNQVILLNKELGTTALTVTMIKNMMETIAVSSNSTKPKEKQVSLEELKAQIDTAFPDAIAQRMTQQMVAISLYSYRNLSDQKLDEYIKIWQSPLGKYYIQNTFEGFDYSFQKMGEIVGKSFSEIKK